MAEIEHEVRRVMEQWQELTVKEDIAGLLALTTDDVVFLTPGHEPIGRDQFAAGLRQVLAKARIESTQEVKEIHLASDLAYAWSHLDIELIPKDGGKGVRNSGYTLSIFRRSPAGDWRLARDANLVAGAGNPDRV
jgi:uncharacterized protein (TIGR02246 family)